ncbi:MAG TPA: CheR family methyltransferase [Candidatus Limnocylindrales bacterium]
MRQDDAGRTNGGRRTNGARRPRGTGDGSRTAGVESAAERDGEGATDGAAEDLAEQLVVIGASAGGIDVLTSLLANVPSDFPTPIVVGQHLDPRRESHLDSILAARTPLTVEVVSQRMRLEPGHLYVIPPNTDIEIIDGHIAPHEHAGRKPAPSIDALLTSAAQAYGEGTIALILTGTGSDGTAGAASVKTAGGTVVIQNPETAAYPGMPRAIPPTIVDIVADADAIPGLLQELVSRRFVPARPEEERLLRSFLEQVKDRSGIDFASYKRATILRRLQRRMAATGSTTLREYVRYVQANPDEYQRLTTAFLIKVTEFFRDADLFNHLRDRVVPRLINDARERHNELRIWSAGCATGEEAYSLAMLVADAVGDEIESFNVRIFATDVDGDAIAFARRGVYPASELSGVPQALIDRHFTSLGDHYEVRKTIRAMTVFGQHDLGQRAPFPRVDLALCRNVLIYFTSELQKRALQLFAFALRDGGYLVLGKAESTTPLNDYFVLEQPRLKIYRREGERVLIPPSRIRDTTPLLPVRSSSGRRQLWPGAPPRPSDRSRQSNGNEKAENLLLRLPVGVVVVDRHYDIQSINAAARRLLGIHGPAINDDLVHLLPEQAVSDVRSALDAAFHGESRAIVFEATVPDGGDVEVRSVEVRCHPVTDIGAPGGDVVLVVVTDVSGPARARRSLEAALGDERREREALLDRSRVLSAANAELVEANQELTIANAELRSANEELLVANEEVQAATEEVETLNEELQATNEELETLNEELQATVEELNTTNDDLQARSGELQESADRLAAEQAAASRGREVLAALLDAIAEPVAALRDEEIVAANRAYRDLFETDGQVFDERGKPLPKRRDPLSRALGNEAVRMRVRLGAPDGAVFDAVTDTVRTSDGPITILSFRRTRT